MIRLNTSYSPDFYFLISYCSFIGMSTVNSGSCIFSSKNDCSFSIINCVFNDCFTTSLDSAGGAIYAVNCNRISIQFGCSYRCYALHIGMFAYINASEVNKLEYYTIIECCPNREGKYHAFYVSGGSFICKNHNSTKNYPQRDTGVWRSNCKTTSMSFCTVYRVSSIILVFLNESIGVIQSCNFAHNDDNTSTHSMFYSLGASVYNLNDCYFKNNNFAHLFKLSGYMTIVNCYFDSDIGPASYVTIQSTISGYMATTLAINHINTAVCHGELPFQMTYRTITKKNLLVFLTASIFN